MPLFCHLYLHISTDNVRKDGKGFVKGQLLLWKTGQTGLVTSAPGQTMMDGAKSKLCHCEWLCNNNGSHDPLLMKRGQKKSCSAQGLLLCRTVFTPLFSTTRCRNSCWPSCRVPACSRWDHFGRLSGQQLAGHPPNPHRVTAAVLGPERRRRPRRKEVDWLAAWKCLIS